jgi:hypothetical protein
MAKISALPFLNSPTGREGVAVLSEGVSKLALIGALVAAAAVPVLQTATALQLEARAAAAEAKAAQEATAGLKEAISAALGTKPFAVAVGAGDVTFETIGVAKVSAIPATARVVVTRGRLNPGDGGAATYKRVAADPANPYFSFRSADRIMPDGSTDAANGGWWSYVLVGNTIYPAQAGAFPDYTGNPATATDSYPALIACMRYRRDAGRAISPEIQLSSGVYYASKTLETEGQFNLKGASYRGNGGVPGFGATWIMVPASTCCLRVNSNGTQGPTAAGIVGRVGNSMSRVSGIVFSQVSWGPLDDTSHAVDMRAAARIENCTFINIAGDGIHIDAYTDGGGRYGEASNWVDVDCFAHSVRGNGHFVRGADANIGYSIGFSTQVCGLAGIADFAYFTNVYIAPHIAGYGTGGVYHKGKLWQLLDKRFQSDEPGTNDRSWYYRGVADVASTRFPQWTAGTDYPLQAPIITYGNPTFVGVYIEGEGAYGYCHGPTATVVGPNMGWTQLSHVMSGSTLGMTTPRGVGQYRGSGDASNPTYPAIGEAEFTVIGAPDPENTTSRVVRNVPLLHRSDTDNMELRWSGGQYRNRDLTYTVNGRPQFSAGGKNTLRTYGGPVPLPGVMTLHDCALQDSNDSANARIIGMRSAAPNREGFYAAGARYLNATSSAAGVSHWEVTVSGAISGGNWAQDYLLVGQIRTSDGQSWIVAARGTGYSQNAPVGAGEYVDPNTGMRWMPVGNVAPTFTPVYLRSAATLAGYDPGPLAPGAKVVVRVSVPGARVGSTVQIVPSIDEGDLLIRGRVVDFQTVDVRYSNPTAAVIDMPAHDVKVVVQNA